MIVMYRHLSIPINYSFDFPFLTSLYFIPFNTFSLSPRSVFASPSRDLELDANLTCVSRMRQDYYSTIFEYEIIKLGLSGPLALHPGCIIVIRLSRQMDVSYIHL